MLHGFAVRKSMVIQAHATILLHPADGPEWLVTLGADRISADRVEDIARAEGARVDVRGSSSDLYLWLWNRDSRAVLDGSQAVADLWTTTVRLRWS